MATALITGANRGIGLEFTRQYANDGWTIIVCCRDLHGEGAAELRDIAAGSEGRVHPEKMDMLDYSPSILSLPSTGANPSMCCSTTRESSG